MSGSQPLFFVDKTGNQQINPYHQAKLDDFIKALLNFSFVAAHWFTYRSSSPRHVLALSGEKEKLTLKIIESGEVNLPVPCVMNLASAKLELSVSDSVDGFYLVKHITNQIHLNNTSSKREKKATH